ncbi:MAG: NAD kinase [Prevotella sp.]|nr:NAD kinase [Prevotella sp.]
MAKNNSGLNERRLRFAVFGSTRQTVNEAAVNALFGALRAHDADIAVDAAYAERLAQANIDVKGFNTFSGNNFEADFAVSVGGDGTFLKTAMRIGSKRVPVMGVNMGRLGYLADVMPAELPAAADCLFNGKFRLARHSVLQVAIEGMEAEGAGYALNDVAVLKRDTASMISVAVHINDDFMATYRADGLIISTPTGSTAYSLSNGGPIMSPAAKTLCLTAVAPHSLNLRPVVVSDAAVVKMKVESRSHNFLLAVDGRSTTLRQGSTVVVRKAPHAIEMVKLPGKRYFDTLRQKMMWAADTRE